MKWKLHFGTHRGTLMSRDASVEEYETLDKCRSFIARAEKDLADSGYVIWYAYAIGPDGQRVELHKEYPYSS